jgi:tRNA/rRNA methyltransferase
LPRVDVVLVRPESAANIGAATRVIRNTGLSGLRLVAPGDWRTVECWRTAWGAQEILEGARVFADLPAAIADASLVAAFSGRRDPGVALADVREVAESVAGLASDDVACLVFGPETSGLTLDELALCGRRALIPSHPDQPSLNLSHAVMVAGYEVFRAATRDADRPRLATQEEKEALFELWTQGLRGLAALPRTNPEPALREWRALLARMELTPRELRLLEHVARKMTAVRPGRRET